MSPIIKLPEKILIYNNLDIIYFGNATHVLNFIKNNNKITYWMRVALNYYPILSLR
jgi:hypothetical protein